MGLEQRLRQEFQTQVQAEQMSNEELRIRLETLQVPPRDRILTTRFDLRYLTNGSRTSVSRPSVFRRSRNCRVCARAHACVRGRG